jgi:SAM-dependent methyltransferase
MSAGELDENQRLIAQAGLEKQVRFVLADARDLSVVSEHDFDAVLMMGPLYHLFTEEDRTTALKEAIDRLKAGGVLFSAFISRLGILGDLLKNMPYWIEDQEEVRSIVEHGRDPHHHQAEGGFRGYFARTSEIIPLHEAIGFETLTLAGVEPAISADDESYNKLEGTQRQLWLDLLFDVSTEPSILGASRHLLYVGRKKST